jgi:hypothetical protein
MKKKLKIIVEIYKNDNLQRKDSFSFQTESLMMRIFFFLILSPIFLYLNLLHCFMCFLNYFLEFISKAKNKLLSIFNKK